MYMTGRLCKLSFRCDMPFFDSICYRKLVFIDRRFFSLVTMLFENVAVFFILFETFFQYAEKSDMPNSHKSNVRHIKLVVKFGMPTKKRRIEWRVDDKNSFEIWMRKRPNECSMNEHRITRLPWTKNWTWVARSEQVQNILLKSQENIGLS